MIYRGSNISPDERTNERTGQGESLKHNVFDDTEHTVSCVSVVMYIALSGQLSVLVLAVLLKPLFLCLYVSIGFICK